MIAPSQGTVRVHYTSKRPYVANVQVLTTTRILNETWLDHKTLPLMRFKKNSGMYVALVKASPVALNVVDGSWNITIYPGSYRLANGSMGRRIDVNVYRAHGAISDRITPHGLIGQSYHDPVQIEGNIDQYVPNTHGEYSTSAQGEGAIEGNIDDYEIKGTPFGTAFVFSRFGSLFPPRDVSKLSGKKLSRASKHMRGAAHSDN
eukprot:CAMPEP_0119319946 /NCGR_PEP_ID=MMETSP1333-20130426/50902_1 /TAXON_ID=418940 /ORGANISM="Scyphosphaera apsteinii, Strain RCC1455" /LENGTH=203 /DNA_ID=CAMNT_0007326503 /DNA_START=312 /DNA_END=926 /DNA_ORIENTATION=+